MYVWLIYTWKMVLKKSNHLNAFRINNGIKISLHPKNNSYTILIIRHFETYAEKQFELIVYYLKRIDILKAMKWYNPNPKSVCFIVLTSDAIKRGIRFQILFFLTFFFEKFMVQLFYFQCSFQTDCDQ